MLRGGVFLILIAPYRFASYWPLARVAALLNQRGKGL